MVEFNPFALKRKTILVVGASSGIGREIAIECSKMGGKIAVCARSEENLKSVLDEMDGNGNTYITADITNQEDLTKLVSDMPVIDGLVISAGIGGTLALQFATREKFDRIFNLNFFAAVELTRLIYKKKKINKGGSIVYISSIAGNNRITPGNVIYGCAKAALSTYMRYAAIEFAGRKVRVNTINPGMTNTNLINSSGALSDEDYQKDMETYPLKRYGEVQDIAPAAIYLLSDASSWVTGCQFVIDGGVTTK
ncbi:SDR family oxidoreductase [Bacteroides uniformis]